MILVSIGAASFSMMLEPSPFRSAQIRKTWNTTTAVKAGAFFQGLLCCSI